MRSKVFSTSLQQVLKKNMQSINNDNYTEFRKQWKTLSWLCNEIIDLNILVNLLL